MREPHSRDFPTTYVSVPTYTSNGTGPMNEYQNQRIPLSPERVGHADGWQPISSPPPNDHLYLVYMPKRTLDCYSCQWWDHREGSFSNDFGITHWMPLPPPPKEKARAKAG